MPNIVWQPDEAKPQNASDIERDIDGLAQGGAVRLTLGQDGWRVRALLPAAMCARGAPAAARDVSDRIADLLLDHDLPVAAQHR